MRFVINKLLSKGDTIHIYWSKRCAMQPVSSWWQHQMEKKSRVSGPLCGQFTGQLPSQRPVTRSFDVLFHLCLNKWLSKQPRRRWFETPSRSLWSHRNVLCYWRIRLLSAMTHIKADSRFAPSQWETALLCNGVYHWLGASNQPRICSRLIVLCSFN